MNWLGVPPTAVLAGIGAIALALGILHLLRVRLHRQTVDSLLLFKVAGAVRRPRALGGRPARWLAFLLALAALTALWSAFADPRSRREGHSRFVLVDWTAAASASDPRDGGTRSDAAARTAASIAAEDGLGPRGRVATFGLIARDVLAPDEPPALLGARLRALRPGGPTSTIWPALANAAATLEDGDEIVIVGGPPELPEALGSIAVHRVALPAALARGVADLRIVDWPERHLVADLLGVAADDRIVLSIDGTELTTLEIAPTPHDTARVELGPLPDVGGRLELTLVRGADRTVIATFALHGRRPIRVAVPDDAPAAVRRAIDADPALRAVGGAEDADVAVASKRSDDLPTLVIATGVEPTHRAARTTSDCPLPLTLRDRRSTDAGALIPAEGGVPWVVDAHSGAPLVAADADGRAIRIAAWLLTDDAHRDVPVLVAGSLRALGGIGLAGATTAGAADAVPAITDTLHLHGATELALLPTNGMFDVRLGAGSWTAGDGDSSPPRAVIAGTGQPREGATDAPVTPLEDLGREATWAPWLIALALLLFGLDAWYHARGRLP